MSKHRGRLSNTAMSVLAELRIFEPRGVRVSYLQHVTSKSKADVEKAIDALLKQGQVDVDERDGNWWVCLKPPGRRSYL